jgi:hypothetical protein
MQTRWPAAALALALLAALPAEAQTRRRRAPARQVDATPASDPAASRSLRVGALIGFDFGSLGFSVRGDAELPFAVIASNVLLSGVGSLGLTRFSKDGNGPIEGASQIILKLVPAARLTYLVAPQIGVYGDAGLGVYYGRTSYDAASGVPEFASDGGFGLTFRFAGGGFYELSDQLRLGAEIGVNPFLWQYEDPTLSVMVGAMYRL